MRRLGPLVLLLLALPLGRARADQSGWAYLIEKLVADGVDRGRVEAVFADRRVEPFVGLTFSAKHPQEPRALYRHFLRPASINAARRCRSQYAAAFGAAERTYGVPANVLATILYVETGCGRVTGSHIIFYRLARLAMANEPANLRRNLAGAMAAGDAATVMRLRARAHYLEATFYPEVRALFAAADRMGVSPLEIRGSESGAFGFPQFLPTSYLAYGVDGDGDGRVSLYDPADAAASCARYFVGHGWSPGLSHAQRRNAVWQYNRSDAYVDTVLTLAARIDGPVVSTPRKTRPKHKITHIRSRPRQQRASAAKKRKADG